MEKKLGRYVAAIIAALAIAPLANAAVITQWNFNSTSPDANVGTGVTTPSTGAGTLALTGGTTSTFATGSLGDPASGGTDNSGLNVTTWPAQGAGSNTAGIKVAVDTTGFTNIVISLDFRQSGTVSRDFQLLVSSDGTNFVAPSGGTASFGTVNSNTGTSFSSAGFYSNNPGGGSQTFVQGISYAFAAGSVYENNPNFAYKWVATFDPANGSNYIAANAGTTAGYSTTGTGRFDMVTVSGDAAPTPEPASLAVLGLGAVGLLRRRK